MALLAASWLFALPGAVAVTTGPALIACVDTSQWAPSDFFEPSGSVSSASACTTLCAGDSIPYSFYYPATGACWCDAVSPQGAAYSTTTQTLAGGEYSLTCGSDDWSVYLSDTSYTWAPATGLCQSMMAAVLTYTTVAGIEECLMKCESSDGAVWTPTTGASVSCACVTGNMPVTIASTTCSSANSYYLTHTAGAYVTDYGPGATQPQASAWAKRDARARLARRRAIARSVCPGTATACVVGGDAASYECIDTRYELESCGGCTAGTYDQVAAPVGVDCTALPGVAGGAVTCRSGQCVAYACTSGYTLAGNGTCI